jgi:hypothetical protein
MTVPKETVELSYMMGENISLLKTSYLLLINTHFEFLEQKRIDYFENEWIPRFIEEWADDGRLLDIAGGKILWSEVDNDYIEPQTEIETPVLLSMINSWTKAAIEQIEEKRKTLINPLKIQENELLVSVEDAFDRLFRGNAAITAYLNSIRKFEEVQDKILDALNLNDLQQGINNRLHDISKYADEELEVIKEIDGFN